MGTILKSDKSVEDWLADVVTNRVAPFNTVHDEVDYLIDRESFPYLIERFVRVLEIRSLMEAVGFTWIKISFDIEFVSDPLNEGAFYATDNFDFYKDLATVSDANLVSSSTTSDATDTTSDTKLETVEFSFDNPELLVEFLIRLEALIATKADLDFNTVLIIYVNDERYVRKVPLSKTLLNSLVITE